MNKKRAGIIAGLTLLAGLSLTGCKGNEWNQDAPVSSRDRSPAEAYDMPDGFSNFASKCDLHGNRVYILFHNSSSYGGIAVVPHDPTCAVGAE